MMDKVKSKKIVRAWPFKIYGELNYRHNEGCTNFPKMLESPQNFRHQEGDMEQVPD